MKEDTGIRFWRKVGIRGPDDCWNWKASTSNGRYGKFKFNGKLVSAHRFAYQLIYGDLKDNMQVQHHCDNNKCVNPRHLYQGTQSDNMRDRQQRTYIPPEVSGYGKGKLYEGEIWLVRKLKGKFSSRFVGKMFKVSQRTILTIWNSKVHLCKENYYA